MLACFSFKMKMNEMRKKVWKEALHVFCIMERLFVILQKSVFSFILPVQLWSMQLRFLLLLSYRPFPACVKINIRTSGKLQRNGQSVLTT